MRYVAFTLIAVSMFSCRAADNMGSETAGNTKNQDAGASLDLDQVLNEAFKEADKTLYTMSQDEAEEEVEKFCDNRMTDLRPAHIKGYEILENDKSFSWSTVLKAKVLASGNFTKAKEMIKATEAEKNSKTIEDYSEKIETEFNQAKQNQDLTGLIPKITLKDATTYVDKPKYCEDDAGKEKFVKLVQKYHGGYKNSAVWYDAFKRNFKVKVIGNLGKFGAPQAPANSNSTQTLAAEVTCETGAAKGKMYRYVKNMNFPAGPYTPTACTRIEIECGEGGSNYYNYTGNALDLKNPFTKKDMSARKTNQLYYIKYTNRKKMLTSKPAKELNALLDAKSEQAWVEYADKKLAVNEGPYYVADVYLTELPPRSCVDNSTK